jgi:DNA end-binding protein Ku
MASLWTGYLTFGLISMPVRLFAGARSEHISFNMLHRDDLVRVKQQLICPAEEKVVDRGETVKGYEFRKGEYVVVEPEEIKKIEPRTAKEMEILEFVRAEEIDPVYFETSYYLLPEEAGRRPYALLEKALEESNFYGIAKLTMHNREYTVILRPRDGGIMLHTMYYQNEVREVEGFGKVDVDLKPAELKVAYQLVEALSADWHPEKYHDNFQDNLKKLIEAKLEGKEVVPVEKPHKLKPAVDLMAALKESLAQTAAKGKKPAQRAGVAVAEKRGSEVTRSTKQKRAKRVA